MPCLAARVPLISPHSHCLQFPLPRSQARHSRHSEALHTCSGYTGRSPREHKHLAIFLRERSQCRDELLTDFLSLQHFQRDLPPIREVARRIRAILVFLIFYRYQGCRMNRRISRSLEILASHALGSVASRDSHCHQMADGAAPSHAVHRD